MNDYDEFTERQRREIAYHSQRAATVRKVRRVVSYEVLENPRRRWWNHYWAAYSLVVDLKMDGKSVLVPGCGEGLDAIRINKLGAEVYAFDISPDMLRVAEKRAAEEKTTVGFRQMACEHLSYASNTFDLIFVHDILHHCELTRSLSEFIRVAKPGAFLVIDELYTHRILQRIRESRFGCWLQPKVVPYIYGNSDAYITQDERKLNDADLSAIQKTLTRGRCTYFNMVVGRFVPSWDAVAKLDRVLLRLLGPTGYVFGGRFILTGCVRK